MELRTEVKMKNRDQLAKYIAMLNKKIIPYKGKIELAHVCYMVPDISLENLSEDDLFFDYPYGAVADELNKDLNSPDSYLNEVNENAIQKLGDTKNGYLFYEYDFDPAANTSRGAFQINHSASNIKDFLTDKSRLLDYLKIIDCSVFLRKSYLASVDEFNGAKKSPHSILTLCQKRVDDEKPRKNNKPNILICSFIVRGELESIAAVVNKIYRSVYLYLGYYFNSPVLPSIFEKRQELHERYLLADRENKAHDAFRDIVNNYGHTIFNLFPPIIGAISDIKNENFAVDDPVYLELAHEEKKLLLTNIIFKILAQNKVAEFYHKDADVWRPKNVSELIDLLDEHEVLKPCLIEKSEDLPIVDFAPDGDQMVINDVFNVLWNLWHNARKCSDSMFGVKLFPYEQYLAISFYNDSREPLHEDNLAYLAGADVKPVSSRGEKGGLAIIKKTMRRLGWQTIKELSSSVQETEHRFLVTITILAKP